MPGDERRWVWVTGPDCYLGEDGRPKPELDPDTGYATGNRWTCHRDTRAGDLAVLYRARQARDVAYLFVAESDASRLPAGAPGRRRFACDYRSLTRLDPPVPIADLRADPVIATWPALRSGFVSSAMAVPTPVWDRLMDLGGLDPAEVARRLETARSVAAAEAATVAALAARPGGPALDEAVTWRTAVPCAGHGTADLVGARADGTAAVVVEVAAGRAGTNTVGRLVGLVDALGAARGVLAVPDLDETARRRVAADPRLRIHHPTR